MSQGRGSQEAEEPGRTGLGLSWDCLGGNLGMVWGRGCSGSIRAVFGRLPEEFLVHSRQVRLARFVEVVCKFSLVFPGVEKGRAGGAVAGHTDRHARPFYGLGAGWLAGGGEGRGGEVW